MPRAVLKIPYTEVPTQRSAAFPGVISTHIPLVKVVFQYKNVRVPTYGLIDSGASLTYVPTGIADALGIDWKACPECPVIGIAGSGTGYVANVHLTVIAAHHGWPAEVAFTPGIDRVGIALLGQYGFFDHCEVTFKARPREFRLKI